MKTALVILPACLLALTHLTSAISLSTEAATDCEHVKNLSPQCKRAFQQGFSGRNQANAFCGGDCFGPVLSAYERCAPDFEAAADNVQGLREGEKSCYIKLTRL